ncbi:PSMB6 [Symbiodinium sp. KB8]|nr:PSMB6 [Symbiodinium sp. KB8]
MDSSIDAAAASGTSQARPASVHSSASFPQTTIMAVRYDGGVVLGADSRTSTGASWGSVAAAWCGWRFAGFVSHLACFVRPPAGIYVANRVSDKLTAVHDRIYCCRSGSAADTQAVSDYVRRFLAEHACVLAFHAGQPRRSSQRCLRPPFCRMDKGSLPTVKTAANLFKQICYEHKDKLMAGIICAGWDKVRGGQVYSIPLGGTSVEQDFAIGGSGSTFIYGLVDATYRKGMTKEECIAFDGVDRQFTAGDALPFMINAEGGGADVPKHVEGFAPAAAKAATAAGGGAAH